MPTTTLYLVRHGEQKIEDEHEGDSGLSPTGRIQAEQLGRRLAGLQASGTSFDAVHHSSLARAVQTTQIVAGHLPGVAVHACDLVRDRTPVPDTYPVRYRDFFAQVPDDERDPGARALRTAVEHLGAVGERERTDLVITHNFVIGWFVRHVLDAPEWRWLGLNQANGAITVVRWSHDPHAPDDPQRPGRPPALISFNDVGHLDTDPRT
ncbi:histidine phosphatase family protein [Kineosporia sp. NBRC 101731]|uniref:histidine phosphatase family protein n=1 Tax=Kineosporia sp. NBRC 101731 TaxID=3032199 RepID=UPI0024A3329A|nr:histidine phosphatase family protein [Kineosporia sp. NBRC 101731]GLY29346.1 phosphoglycerate mutase [Kineosporia sp. NBRC 101731]